jgi:S-adenosylmethionine hydrolase
LNINRYIDRFGNCITSIHTSQLDIIGGIEDKSILFSHNNIKGIHRTYSDVRPGEPLVYIGSSGFLEIGIREGNASAILGLRVHADVRVE